MTGNGKVEDQSDDDIALLLAAELKTWIRNLGRLGVLPRSFTGVTKEGKQLVLVLTNLPLNHFQRRSFIIWLCRIERFEAYGLGTRVGIAEDGGSIAEAYDIYASSPAYDVAETMNVKVMEDGKYHYTDRHHAVLPAEQDNGIIFGLQRSKDSISNEDVCTFQNLWRDLKPRALWTQP